MSYPQTNSNLPLAQAGANSYRIRTPLASAGDIYESEQSAVALSLGPDSDLDQIFCAYFDPFNGPTFLNTAAIPQQGYLSRVDARLDAQYQPAGRPGRLFFYPANIFDPNYTPLTFNAANDKIIIETPILDVIQHFSVPAVPPPAKRNNKLFQYKGQSLTPAGPNTSWIVVPFYGRGSASVHFYNLSGGNVTFGILGLRYGFVDYSLTPVNHDNFEQTILAAAAQASTQVPLVTVVKTSVTGYLDALVLSVNPGLNDQTRVDIDVVVSDTVL
jgi:hypothetical protein